MFLPVRLCLCGGEVSVRRRRKLHLPGVRSSVASGRAPVDEQLEDNWGQSESEPGNLLSPWNLLLVSLVQEEERSSFNLMLNHFSLKHRDLNTIRLWPSSFQRQEDAFRREVAVKTQTWCNSDPFQMIHRFLEPWTLFKCIISQFHVIFATFPNRDGWNEKQTSS